jgi:hypothetical protein
MNLLIRLYPRAWRDRYAEEFAVLLEDRPLGPFDVMDILLGALDARLHLRAVGAQPATGARSPLSIRIGSGAAVAGGVLWIVALMVTVMGPKSDSNLMMAPVAIALLTLLVALAALSAVQSRSHPVLVWASFLLPAVGILLLAAGATAQLAVGERPVIVEFTPYFFWIVGALLALVGCVIFGIVSGLTGGLTRWTAGLLIVGAVVQLVTLVGHPVERDGEMVLVGAFAFGLSWILVGVAVSRAERDRVIDRAA